MAVGIRAFQGVAAANHQGVAASQAFAAGTDRCKEIIFSVVLVDIAAFISISGNLDLAVERLADGASVFAELYKIDAIKTTPCHIVLTSVAEEVLVDGVSYAGLR